MAAGPTEGSLWLWADPRPRARPPRAPAAVLSVSLADRSIFQASRCQNRAVCSPRPVNHLFTQFGDYSCSFGTSSPTCHGASRGRHPHSCTNAARLLLHGNRLGRVEAPRAGAPAWEAHSHPGPLPTGAVGVGGPHCASAFQPKLVSTAGGWQAICHWQGRCARLSFLTRPSHPSWVIRFNLGAVCWEPVRVDLGLVASFINHTVSPANSSPQKKMGRYGGASWQGDECGGRGSPWCCCPLL